MMEKETVTLEEVKIRPNEIKAYKELPDYALGECLICNKAVVGNDDYITYRNRTTGYLSFEHEFCREKKNKEINIKRQKKHFKRKIGRNEPCPCGSGKKFKKCCLKYK